MKTIYKQTQIGKAITLIICTVILGMGLMLMLAPEARILASFVLTVSAINLICFTAYTVEVNTKQIISYYGPGLFRRVISICDISYTKVARSWIFYGNGIIIASTWSRILNEGIEVVELNLKNKRKCWIGAENPVVLLSAIKTAMQENQQQNIKT